MINTRILEVDNGNPYPNGSTEQFEYDLMHPMYEIQFETSDGWVTEFEAYDYEEALAIEKEMQGD